MLLQGMDPKMVEQNYKEMVEKLKDKLIQPMLDQWQKYYDATGKMSDMHVAMENRNLTRQYEHMAKVLRDQEAAYEWLIEKANEAAVKRLEAEETLTAGMQAAWYRLYEEQETLSKMISDIWVKGAHNVEEAWKETFFDTINGEWDNFEEHAVNILTSIRDTLNEMLYAMIKDWAKAKFGDWFKKLIGFDREKAAQDTLKQTTAIAAQNTVLGTQVGIVGTLTASYWALSMAMAACGMGGGSSMVRGVDTGGVHGWGGLEQGFQHGGKIDELIYGVGQRTGKTYSFGEHGTKEYVIPEKKFADISFQYGTKLEERLSGRKSENTSTDIAKLSQLAPNINNTLQQTNTIEINVPVSVEGNNKLAGKIRSEVESLIKDIMREEMR